MTAKSKRAPKDPKRASLSSFKENQISAEAIKRFDTIRDMKCKLGCQTAVVEIQKLDSADKEVKVTTKSFAVYSVIRFHDIN